MTLKFLDLYNAAASQEWSMYDNNAQKTEDFEPALVLALNKAVTEILYSYPFSFRERTHLILTIPNIKSYNMPSGLITQDKSRLHCVKVNSKPLIYIKNEFNLPDKKGIPEGFYIRGSKIVLYPTPNEKFIVTVDYLTLVLGENSDGDVIFSLKNADDVIDIPEYLEEIFKNAVIARTILYSIAGQNDENYSAYKKQSEIAYRQLVKFAKGVWQDKKLKI